ncbi:MAG TPA: VWA domain-containing protein [Thermoanaerobaculia bacterium]|nr:VWA domain-containing protein [Thermoanaerobaculia bacterium]
MLAVFVLGVPVVEAAQAADVHVRTPREGEPVFGPVEVWIEVDSAERVAEVEVELDGVLVATLREAPYRTVVDVGQENVSHVILVTVTGASGARATVTRTTGAITIDEEVDLELQQLYVTVSRDGERVLDLDADRFRVLDDREPQVLVTFERGDVPLTAVLLIDASLSMEGEGLAAALSGARAFVEEMGELDEAKVIVFSDRLLAATTFTGDPAVVAEVVDRVTPSGSTAINDHLYFALSELGARPGRRVIVLLSDGLDVDSVLRMADVEWKAGRVQSVIYWIRPTFGAELDRPLASVWRDDAQQRREIEGLRETVRSNGGREYVIERIEDASTAFRELLAELGDQYVLGYYPTRNENDGAWHQVEVRVDEPRVDVGVRGGYYDSE